jgi:O-antigen/teichoic acid export membrane protein
MAISSLKARLVDKLRSGSIRHIGLYTSGTLVSKGISFIALPFFTYYISEAGFGILALITNSVLLLNAFILFSTNITLNTEYFKKDKQSYNNLFTSLFTYVCSSTILSALIIAIFFHPLQRLFGFQWYYIFLLPFLTFLNFFSEQLNNYLRLRHESITFFISNTLKAIIEVGLALGLLYIFRNDYYARIISITVSSLFFGIYAAYYFFIKMKLWGKFEIRTVINEIPFGASYMIMQVANFLTGSSDKFFVKYFYTNELTGIYNIASTLAGILYIFSSAITSYLLPNLYKSFAEDSRNKLTVVRAYFVKYVIAMAMGSLLVFLTGTIVYFFLIKRTYLQGYVSFCVLLAGGFFYALSLFFYPILWYYRAKRKLVTLATISIISSLFLYYFLTKYYSINGAAVALLISYFIQSILINRITIRLLNTVV